MFKKLLLTGLTLAGLTFPAGCQAASPARVHYAGAVAVNSGHYYAPAPAVVYRPSPPPAHRAYLSAPSPHYGPVHWPAQPHQHHRGPAHPHRRH